MSPFLYEHLIHDHQDAALSRAELRAMLQGPRGARQARAGRRRTIRGVVGFRLIAIGVRLIEDKVATVEDLDRAA